MAAGLIADRNRNTGEIIRSLDLGVARYKDARGGNGIRVAIELAVTFRRCNVDCPVARATDVGRPAFFKRLICAAVAGVMRLAFSSLNRFVKYVVEAFGPEITLQFGDPFL